MTDATLVHHNVTQPDRHGRKYWSAYWSCTSFNAVVIRVPTANNTMPFLAQAKERFAITGYSLVFTSTYPGLMIDNTYIVMGDQMRAIGQYITTSDTDVKRFSGFEIVGAPSAILGSTTYGLIHTAVRTGTYSATDSAYIYAWGWME